MNLRWGLYKTLHDILDICLQRKRRALYKVLFSFSHLVQKGEFKVAKLETTKGKLKLNRLQTTDLIQGVTVYRKRGETITVDNAF